MTKKKPKSKPGPEEERLKLEGPWEDRVKEALEKPRPEDGWPDPEKGNKTKDEESSSE